MRMAKKIVLGKAKPIDFWNIEDENECNPQFERIIFEAEDESIFFGIGKNDHATCIEWKFAALVLFPKKKKR